MLQIIAMLSMLIDHIGLYILDDYLPFRLIGRLAAPIYAYFIVCAVFYSKDFTKHLCKLLIIGMISEIPYLMLHQKLQLNVILYWAVASYLLNFIVHRHKSATRLLLMLLSTLVFYYLPFEGSWYYWFWCCIWLMIEFGKSMEDTGSDCCLISLMLFTFFLLIFCIKYNIGYCIFSLVSIPIVWILSTKPYNRINNNLFKKVYSWFYPAHLLVLWYIIK